LFRSLVTRRGKTHAYLRVLYLSNFILRLAFGFVLLTLPFYVIPDARFKDNTLLPGEWYGGQLHLQPLASDAGDHHGVVEEPVDHVVVAAHAIIDHLVSARGGDQQSPVLRHDLQPSVLR